MGEHQGSGRVVDSTTDRLELLAEGDFTGKGFSAAGLAACVNGIHMPLQQVSDTQAVCGLRYRLFDNPWGLQPHIKPHSPLSISIVHQPTMKIVHGFEYYNWKLLGEGYDGLPENAKQARARVDERLAILTSLIGKDATMSKLPVSPQAPYTLDLRRSNLGSENK